MGVLKTLLVGTLAVLGGCTVVVGGCTVGATKAGLETLDTMASVAEKNHFNKLYSQSPARAEAKYQEVAADCYEETMRLTLGTNVPKHVIDARVDFDIYEIRINQSRDQNNIKHLPAWRAQSDNKIVASVADKTQRRAVKKHLKKVKKGHLLENMCIANGLAPEQNKSDKYRQASLRR